MKTVIKGQNYDFCIVADGTQFYIEAMHPVSFRFSFINNLNAILSAFDININDKKVSESQWLVSEEQCSFFFKKATEFLSSKYSRDCIEQKLNEDRQLGEWENLKRN
jgi:hypothetical protein